MDIMTTTDIMAIEIQIKATKAQIAILQDKLLILELELTRRVDEQGTNTSNIHQAAHSI